MSKIHQSHDTTFYLQSLGLPQIEYAPSLFATHRLGPGTYQNEKLQKYPPDWMLGIILFGFVLLAWTQLFYNKRVKQIILSPFSKRFHSQLVREGNLFKERVSLSLLTVYLVSGGLLLFRIDVVAPGTIFSEFEGITRYLIFLALITGYWTVKIFLVWFLGFVFKTRETTNQYLLNILVFCLITGPVFLVFLVFILYTGSIILIKACLVVAALFFFFRIIRGFMIGSRLRKFSYLFLFVYLCSLEILPLFFLIKIVLIYTNSLST